MNLRVIVVWVVMALAVVAALFPAPPDDTLRVAITQVGRFR